MTLILPFEETKAQTGATWVLGEERPAFSCSSLSIQEPRVWGPWQMHSSLAPRFGGGGAGGERKPEGFGVSTVYDLPVS